MKKLLFFLLLLNFSPSHAEMKLRFASIFSDNMVLQQQSTVNLWGYAPANEELHLKCSWLPGEVIVKSHSNGSWSAGVKTPQANFTAQSVSLTSASGQTASLSNVLIGEVWLCSGQSNMEMILMSQPAWNLIVEGSEAAIDQANNPNLRFVNIQRKESFVPLEDALSYPWKVGTSNDVKWLSAVAYFFGKKLSVTLNVPVGLIVSAYGGSPIQSWIPENIINSRNIYANEKENRDDEIKASRQTEEEYQQAMKKWIADGEAQHDQRGKSKIQTIQVPVNFENSPMGNQMGEISLSRTVILPKNKTNDDLIVNLGTMDDLGRVFFNGELVWEEIRNSKSYQQVQFTVPASKLKVGANRLEVHVLNILWGGGLTGPVENMFYQVVDEREKISLAGEWQFYKIFDLVDATPIPREGKPLFSTASSLYNGMIYPLKSFTVKGVLWYQGESNVGDESRYAQMMTDLIGSWRKSFESKFPFYYVQIAPYRYGGTQTSKAVELREAQSKVEKTTSQTGMVVTIDLGNPDNIHPARKQEVGERLAGIALSETYGKNVPNKFPQLKSARQKGESVVLNFTNVYRGLKVLNNQQVFELSADGKNYYPADMKVFTNTIQLNCAKLVRPKFVRYCWDDISAGTVFNSADLPLSSFQTEIKQ